MTLIMIFLSCFSLPTKWVILTRYSQAPLFRSHSHKKRNLNYSKFELSEYIEKEILKTWMIDQECRTSVQGVGGGPNPYLSCSLIACNVGGHTHIHTPESLAARSIALHVLSFLKPGKVLPLSQNLKHHPKIASN